MPLLDWLRDRWTHEAPKCPFARIDSSRIRLQSGEAPDDAPLRKGQHYFRLWLSEMYLKNDRQWGAAWHPALQTAVQLRFGDQVEDLTHVAGSSRLQDIGENLNRGVDVNHALTPLLPFNGGIVEFDAALLAIKGADDVATLLNVLGNFSNIFMTPQLSAALAVGRSVASGISELIGATSNELQLPLHQSWVETGGGGDAVLRAGYFVTIRANADEIDLGKLGVKGDRLYYGDSLDGAKPLTGFHYMLFRLERRSEYAEWDSLSAIREPFQRAMDELKTKRPRLDEADAYIQAAKVAALNAKELTSEVDQLRVPEQIEKQYKLRKNALQSHAVDNSVTTLSAAMKSAKSPAETIALGRAHAMARLFTS